MRGRVPSISLAVAAAGTFSVLALAQAPTPAAPPASPVAFARDIQPILEKSCWNCHSADVQLADLIENEEPDKRRWWNRPDT